MTRAHRSARRSIDWPAVILALALVVAAWVATAGNIGELPDVLPSTVYAAGGVQ